MQAEVPKQVRQLIIADPRCYTWPSRFFKAELSPTDIEEHAKQIALGVRGALRKHAPRSKPALSLSHELREASSADVDTRRASRAGSDTEVAAQAPSMSATELRATGGDDEVDRSTERQALTARA